MAKATRQRGGKKPEFPGLTAAAAKIGVSRYFLWKVLKGYAVSRPTMDAWKKFKLTHG